MDLKLSFYSGLFTSYPCYFKFLGFIGFIKANNYRIATKGKFETTSLKCLL